jgi:DNA (cytosine-5)-methyltransferase 1
MRYISVCSGIEAATVAWHPLGWTPAAFAEIDKFPSRVLAHHYPEVPNVGDFTKIRENQFDSVELLTGGTPCQDFSVAGLRAGLDGKRGQLTIEYAHLAGRLRPRWLVITLAARRWL